MEMGVPVRVTEHHVGGAIRAVFIGVVEEAAEMGLNPKSVEIVSTRLQTPGRRWILIRIECHLSDAVGYKVLEAIVTLAQVQIIGIRLVVIFMARALQRIDTFSLRNIQRPQDQPI